MDNNTGFTQSQWLTIVKMYRIIGKTFKPVLIFYAPLRSDRHIECYGSAGGNNFAIGYTRSRDINI